MRRCSAFEIVFRAYMRLKAAQCERPRTAMSALRKASRSRITEVFCETKPISGGPLALALFKRVLFHQLPDLRLNLFSIRRRGDRGKRR